MEVTISTADAVEQFLRMADTKVETGQIRPATAKQYRQYLPRLVALQTMAGWTLGDAQYAEITKAEVASVLHAFAQSPGIARKGRRLDDGTREVVASGLPAAQTIRNARSTLGSFFAELDLALGIDRPNPAHGIDLRRVIGRRPTKEPTALTTEEVESLIAAMSEAYRPLVTLICDTGMRSAEARGLRWVDVSTDTICVQGQADDHGGYVEVGKTNHSLREIPLTKRAKAALAEQFKLTGDGEFVFATRSGGTGTNANLWRAVRRGCDRAGIPPVGVHDLRHTFGMLAVERGMPIPVLSKLMGHSDPGFTASRYLRAEIDLAAKRRAMDAAFGGEA